jgi:hypothetical protein
MQYQRFLLTLLLTVLSYKSMVTAFSLMNKPSDIALYGGATLLAVTAIGFITMVRLLWRRSTR